MSPKSNKTPADPAATTHAPTAYVPLARKYRPQRFAELIGQEHVATTLANAITGGRLAHAYLFAGPRGTGKTSTARIFAKSLNCEPGPTTNPCQRCTSCVEITRGSSLDVLEIDGASNRGIDEVLRLRDSVKFAPTHGRRKVYIIDEVHQITHDGFNALLKTLEEPPAHVTFIFATTAPQKVPATILSRCQRFDFRRIPTASVVEQLRRIAETESINIDDASLFAMARAADGSLRDAESVLDQLASFSHERIRPADVHTVLGVVETEALAQWVDAILYRKLGDALGAVDRLLDSGKELDHITQGLIEYVRHLIVVKACPPAGELIGGRRLIELPEETIRQLAAQAAPAALDDLLGMVQVLLHAQDRMRRSPLARIILDVALVQLATRETLQPIDELLAKLDALIAAAPTPAPATHPVHAGGERPNRSTPTMPLARPSSMTLPPTLRAAPAPSSPTASAVTAAAVVDAPTLSSEALQALWPRLLDRIGRVKMSTAAYLSEGRPIEACDGVLRVALPASSLHVEMLETPDSRRAIEESLSQLLDGARLRVAFSQVAALAPVPSEPAPPPMMPPRDVVAPAAHQAAPAAHHAAPPDIVQTAAQLFNAQIVGGTP